MIFKYVCTLHDLKFILFTINFLFHPCKQFEPNHADPYQQSYPQQPGGSGYQQHGGANSSGGAGDQQKFGGYAYPGMPPVQPPHVGFVPLVQPQPVPGPNPYSNAYPGGFVDPENPLGPEVKGFDFTEQSVRKGFIRKVYAILSVSSLVQYTLPAIYTKV